MIIEIDGKKFLWDQKWVRPFESVFSVMRNFCNVNAMNGTNAFKMLGGTMIGSNRFNEQTLSWELSTSKSSPDLSCLVPCQTIPDSFHIVANPKDIFSRTWRICPECMKENHHSFLHNYKGIQKCPLHPNVDIVDTGIPYHIQKGIEYSMEDDGIVNVRGSVLPVERKVPDGHYQKIKVQFPEGDIYLINFEGYKEYKTYVSLHKMLLESRKPDKLIPVEKMKFDATDRSIQEEYELFYGKWIAKQQIPYSIFTNQDEYDKGNITAYTPGRNYMKSFMYYKNCSLLKPYIGTAGPDRKAADSLNGCIIAPENDFMLRLDFAWRITNCKYLQNIYSYYMFNRPASYVWDWMERTDKEITGYISIRFDGFSHPDWIRLCLQTYSDVYDYLFKQFVALAKKECGIHSVEGFNSLKTPEYYLIITPGDQNNLIYRFDPE